MNPTVAGIVRFLLNAGGTWLVAHGVLSATTSVQAIPYVETIVGAALSLGSLAWNLRTHTPSGIGRQLQQVQQNKVGPEGQTQPNV